MVQLREGTASMLPGAAWLANPDKPPGGNQGKVSLKASHSGIGRPGIQKAIKLGSGL